MDDTSDSHLGNPTVRGHLQCFVNCNFPVCTDKPWDHKSKLPNYRLFNTCVIVSP